MCQASSDGGAAAADTYIRDTVRDVSVTAPCASSRPTTSPSAQPGAARHSASPRNSANTVERDVPTARSMPISWRRVSTEAETVL